MGMPYYNIQHEITDFDDEDYGWYAGFVYSAAFVPTLLLTAPVSATWNRKLTVGLSSIGWGLCIMLHAFAHNKYHFFILFSLTGALHSLGSPLTFILITEYFEPRARVRAFFVFSILSQLGDPIIFLTTDLISMFGWRNTWIICGLSSIIPGVLCTLTVSEPSRQDEVTIKVDQEDDDHQQHRLAIQKAQSMINERQLQDQLEVISINHDTSQIRIRKKQQTYGEILKDYHQKFGMFFSNKAAVMIILACFFRYWTQSTQGVFMQKYFQVHSNRFQSFSSLSALASFAGGLTSTLFTGMAIEHFEKQSEMTIPMVCLIKAVVDIPCLLMIFFQQSSFTLGMAGVFLEYFFAKGWTSAAILILKTVVDPSIAPLSVSMFMLTASVVSTVSSQAIGDLTFILNLSPTETPAAYGNLITLFTVVPTLISIPLFFKSGLAMRSIKQQKSEETHNDFKAVILGDISFASEEEIRMESMPTSCSRLIKKSISQ